MACGSSAPAQPSTTTAIQDLPAWEVPYVQDVMGQAQTEAAQPYQQFPGQQVAGFTPDQTQSFSNVEGQQAAINPLQSAATGQSAAGANTANNIVSAANPLIQASTMAASPEGIQSYLNPFEGNVVQGLENTATQNWNQNIMPGVNNEFVGSGQSMSGRNAQVLGQAANEEQTNLDTSVANTLAGGYNTAGTEAATEAGILGSAGSTLGNLEATQGNEQLGAGTNLQGLATSQNSNALTNNEALQAVGQQQQQLNQTNLNTAEQNFQNQVQYPEQQTSYLSDIIHGLPTPSATTAGSQTTPAYSVSPLSALGGSGTTALALSGTNGNPLGTIGQAAKKGGLIKGYAEGGQVDDDPDSPENMDNIQNPLLLTDEMASPDDSAAKSLLGLYDEDFTGDGGADYAANGGDPSGHNTPAPPAPAAEPLQQAANAQQSASTMPNKVPLDALDTPDAKNNNKNPHDDLAPQGLTQSDMQRNELLALARGMLTPSLGGSTAAALGTGIGNVEDLQTKYQQMQLAQNNTNYQRQQDAKRLGIEQARENTYETAVANKGAHMDNTDDLSQQKIDAKTNKPPASVNSPTDELRRETLAQNAFKANAPLKGIAAPTLDDYRQYYGLPPKSGASSAPQVNAPAPGNKPTQSDIDYLKRNPSMASKFEGRFGAGTASQYAGQ